MSQSGERVVVFDLAGEVPPPSAPLRARVHEGGAVMLRRPARVVAQLLFGWGLLGGLVVALVGLRPDLVALSHVRFTVLIAAWSVLLTFALIGALVPARGYVLPSSSRARLAAVLVPLSGLLLAVELCVDAPGYTRHLDGAATLPAMVHCLGLAAAVLCPALGAAFFTLRRLAPVGARYIGAALGAAAGALAALVLHVICPIGGALHLGGSHGSGIVLGALLGFALGALLDCATPADTRRAG